MWTQSDERKCVVSVVDTEQMEFACVVPTMKYGGAVMVFG